MIIFDLDGTLADCEHRRHFVEPPEDKCCLCYDFLMDQNPNKDFQKQCLCGRYPGEWKCDFQAFYEACGEDQPIWPVIQMLLECDQPYEIWSGRCGSVREKTEAWIMKHVGLVKSEMPTIRMRPIGDFTPDDELKEKWLDERISDMGNQAVSDIEFVFDDRPKVVRMWRRRGIFVFNCCQHEDEF